MGVDLIVLQQLAVSFGLGLLLGLQRERAESSIGGIRTFPLIAIFGTVCALLGKTFGGWIVAAGLLALAAIVIYSNFAKIKSGDIDPGMTTEVAALLLYGLGAYVVIGSMVVTVVVGGAMAVLLQFKKPLHALAGAIGERDMRAIMQFVLLSLVILPVLPHQDFGPYGVWNPFQIWLMVVLIVGISLTGYIAYKCLGARRGTLLAGVLGGLISSTATTVSYARRTVENIKLVKLATVVIVIASCISLGRVLVEMATVAPVAFASMAPPVAAVLAVSIIVAAAMFLWRPSGDAQMPRAKKSSRIETGVYFCRDLRCGPARGRRRQGPFRLCRFLHGSHRFRTN
jgi:uncharacterized membrane protein (DUF4010 family)